jgi:putative transposase
MDDRGRCWYSIKYEEVYLKEYLTLPDTRIGIERYFRFYNESCLHQSLDYKTLEEIHFSTGNK